MPGQTNRRSRKRLAVIVLMVTCVAAGVWLLWPTTQDAPIRAGKAVQSRQLLPSSTRRARRVEGTRGDGQSVAMSADRDAPGSTTLRIDIHPRNGRGGRVLLHHHFEPRNWFPTAEEMGLHELETARLLDEVLDDNDGATFLVDPDDVVRLNESASRDGLLLDQLDGDEDPWRRLLAIHIALTSRSADRMARILRARRPGADPSEFPLAPSDGDAALEQAMALVAQHPEHDAAEFAWLYILQALQDVQSTTYDVETGFPLALDLLYTSPDPLVREAAARLLSPGIPEHLRPSEDDWWRLDAVIDSLHQAAPDVAWFLLDQARTAEDPVRIRSAFFRYDEAVDRRCPDWVDHGPLAPCTDLSRSVESLRGELLEEGLIEPQTWRDAVVSTVRRCAPTRHAALSGQHDGDIWTWSPEDGTDELAQCMRQSGALAPKPSRPMDLTVDVRVWSH